MTPQSISNKYLTAFRLCINLAAINLELEVLCDPNSASKLNEPNDNIKNTGSTKRKPIE